MTDSQPELLLDPQGIPILTERVSDEELEDRANSDNGQARGKSIASIANDLLDSELFQQQLDEISRELSHEIRMQLEQTLGTALEAVVNEALEHNKQRSYELIRKQLENSLPGLLAKIIQDEGIAT